MQRKPLLLSGTGPRVHSEHNLRDSNVGALALGEGGGMTAVTPNILWICTDQQRFDTIHALGNEHIRTPNIDRLVAEGVAFTNAYAQSPICTPSRASFLTGCYPSTIHVHRNGNAGFPADVPLVTRVLADSGYDCGLVGKLHLSAAHGRVEARPDDGYRVFKWSHKPPPEPFWPTEQHDYQHWLRERGIDWDRAYGAVTPEKWQTEKQAIMPKEWTSRGVYQHLYRSGIAAQYHQSVWCADETIAFLSERHDGPWLMSVNPFDPHPPIDPPPEYLSQMDPTDLPLPLFQAHELETQRAFAGIDFQTTMPKAPDEYDARRMVAAYYAQIELIDVQVGRLLRALDRTGQRENTIIIFMSDHGEMLGDHGLMLKGCRFYEGLVHVPLIISWPGHFETGLRSEALVELLDIVPTLLEVANLSPHEHLQGRSLQSILTGRASPEWHHAFVRSEYHDALALPNGTRANMIFDGRHKLALYHGHGIGELYDLLEDPHEFNNLWDSPSANQQKQWLLEQAFDSIMLAADKGNPRVARY